MQSGYRLVPEDYASSAFDGEGAKCYGGRWNSVGVAVVYASTSRSLAILENRVHIDKTKMLKRYKFFKFHFDDALVEIFPLSHLPKDWLQSPPPPSLQHLGDSWVKSGRSTILLVPSIITPGEMNCLLNPHHPDFGKIKIDKPTDFAFDPRLFK